MKTACVASLLLALTLTNQGLGASARAEVPVPSVPAMGQSIHTTYGPAPRRPEAGLPDRDTSGVESYTRSPRDWERDYGGLSSGTRSPDTQDHDRSGLSDIIINFGGAVEHIQRATGSGSAVPPHEPGGGDFDELGTPPSSGPEADGPIGQDDFDVADFNYRALAARRSADKVARDRRSPTGGQGSSGMTPPLRRHVPPVVIRGSEPYPVHHPKPVADAYRAVPPCAAAGRRLG